MASFFGYVVGLWQAVVVALGIGHVPPPVPVDADIQAKTTAQQTYKSPSQIATEYRASTGQTGAQATTNQQTAPYIQDTSVQFTALPSAGPTPLMVHFVSNKFATQDSAEPQHYIDFADGTERGRITCAKSTGADLGSFRCLEWGLDHQYASSGTYTAKLIEIAGCTTNCSARSENVLKTISVTVSEGNTIAVSVPGMSKYTDTDFGFSFWYPSGWTVTNLSGTGPGMFAGTTDRAGNLSKGRLIIKGDGVEINIDKIHSDERTYRVNPGACGSCGPVAYSFNPDSHVWMMTTSDQQPPMQPADVSNNSMGGLHIFLSRQKESAVIVPLSARDFVFVKDITYSDQCGSYCASPAIKGGAQFLAKTILALDPSVAAPVRAAEQIKTIEAEKEAYTKP